MDTNINKSTIKNAIDHAKTNLCNVYFYEDGTYSEYKFAYAIGIIEYHKNPISVPYFELWLGQYKGLKFRAH